MRKIVSIGIIYEIFLAAMVVLSLTLDLPSEQGRMLDWFIWSIFMIDYIVRLWRAENKWKFFREHPLEFISILPLDQFLRVARLVRLVRILRLIVLLNHRVAFLDYWLQRYKVDTVILVVMTLLFMAALPMKWMEPDFHTYEDAFWWAIVTMTTVGYGDLSPVTTTGRIIASFLMLSGIGMIGVVTGTVASIFTGGKEKEMPKELQDVMRVMNDYPQLDKHDYNYMIGKLERLRDSH